MLEFILSLPFSIEVWKTTTILCLAAIVFLVNIYNKYFKLQDFIESEIKEQKKILDEIKRDINEDINEDIKEIKIQREELRETINKFIDVITTTDDISSKQKEQIALLNKIIDNFRVTDVCEIKESLKEQDSDSLNLRKLLDLICEDYELHKKE